MKKKKSARSLKIKEVLISLIWLAEIVAVGFILNKTSYSTPVMIIMLIGLVASLIVMNYKN
ncbi:hypothetical protein D6777_03405 [Candidatus Woesearchaeota archaeon]|nr:MAG: hypothetical protein D6777_03405 [Candidatus Woesearchaeota archaeon]